MAGAADAKMFDVGGGKRLKARSRQKVSVR